MRKRKNLSRFVKIYRTYGPTMERTKSRAVNRLTRCKKFLYSMSTERIISQKMVFFTIII